MLILANRNSKYSIHSNAIPMIADGIPIPANQLPTGVIFSSRNKYGKMKTISEPSVSGIPIFLITSGEKISQPNGTDNSGYSDHVKLRSIAKLTIRQVMIAIIHAIEKILKISFPVSDMCASFIQNTSLDLQPFMLPANHIPDLQSHYG